MMVRKVMQRKQQQQEEAAPRVFECSGEEGAEQQRKKATPLFRRLLVSASSKRWSAFAAVSVVLVCGALILGLRDRRPRDDNAHLSSTITEASSSRTAALTSLADFNMTSYLGRGSVNVAIRAKRLSPNPNNLRGDNNIDDMVDDVVVKLIDTREYGHAELESFALLMKIDRQKALTVGFLQPIWATRDVANPFHCPLVQSKSDKWDDNICIDKYHSHPSLPDMSSGGLARLRFMPTMDVLVMPYVEPRYIKDTARSMADVVTFFRSMLEQLMVAHDSGVNNVDLQINRNMFVEHGTGRAIMFDWNSYIPMGAPTDDPHQNGGFAAPEAWL